MHVPLLATNGIRNLQYVLAVMMNNRRRLARKDSKETQSLLSSGSGHYMSLHSISTSGSRRRHWGKVPPFGKLSFKGTVPSDIGRYSRATQNLQI